MIMLIMTMVSRSRGLLPRRSSAAPHTPGPMPVRMLIRRLAAIRLCIFVAFSSPSPPTGLKRFLPSPFFRSTAGHAQKKTSGSLGCGRLLPYRTRVKQA